LIVTALFTVNLNPHPVEAVKKVLEPIVGEGIFSVEPPIEALT
jgi:hypothetical protein